MTTLNFKKFIGMNDGLQRAKAAREAIDPNNVPKYYLPYLDEILPGIAPSELVVIGADTGIGKTYIANHIARENAARGRKVYIFSLEGHKNEIFNRWKWEIICREYYKKPHRTNMRYGLYEVNALKTLAEEEAIAEEELRQLENNLFVFDRSADLDVTLLTQQINLIQDADLVIIDHLHYFNMLDDRSETENITMIMRAIKDLTDMHNTPVVLISHLRKRDKKFLPDNDDFHGSSNIPKIATTCILFSTNPEEHQVDLGKYSTFLRVSKSRLGAETVLCGKLFFDLNQSKYEYPYSVGKITNGTYKELEHEHWPSWAQAKGGME